MFLETLTGEGSTTDMVFSLLAGACGPASGCSCNDAVLTTAYACVETSTCYWLGGGWDPYTVYKDGEHDGTSPSVEESLSPASCSLQCRS